MKNSHRIECTGKYEKICVRITKISNDEFKEMFGKWHLKNYN